MTEKSAPSTARKMYLAGGIAVAVSLLLILGLLLARHRSVSAEGEERRARVQAGQRIQVAVATRSGTTRTVTLTGEARPYTSVTLYAKVSGYLKEIRVDKGDKVSAGEILAVLESPELNSQYRAALADARNKRLFAQREMSLLQEGFISQQEADNALSAARAAEETAAAYRSTKGYQILKAPFEGVVTARFADPGALMQGATGGQAGALPVVTVSQTNRLRIYLYLDQKAAAQVKRGDIAIISDPARPQVRIPAPVSRISGELDPKSRTMLVELDLMNQPQRVLAGGFVDVSLTLETPPYPQVPVGALLTRAEKSVVAVVGPDERISFREVKVVDSDGKMLRIGEGIQEGERVALQPGTSLVEGDRVQPVLAPANRKGQ
ncbi:efflux RND transporter periplasmic adaptor subunit [Geomonas sp. RF6]|uniref:efflux RND transporter periplasmic adaptor subunit n=1 Tax=Geomonas sp. RF6 TaxID=2897342 RepID=UPI001E3C7755|nr:efflux RND transporter periplasmic adaptor subunit [Geomonas sp. RF6]UFS69523.1 efflux RND transporter periplasmic adaptor subunit [Geomonas sp. RF6]